MKVLYSTMIVTALALTGCASGPHATGGIIFTSVKGPIVATPMAKAGKEGTACASNILGMIATGDNSIMSAKDAGGVKKISSVDYTRFSILGVYEKVCTVVKGS